MPRGGGREDGVLLNIGVNDEEGGLKFIPSDVNIGVEGC